MLTRICLILLTVALAAQAVTYSYDSAGRLVKADYGAAGAIVYVYDNAGNLVNRTAQTGAGSASAGLRPLKSVSGEAPANSETRPPKAGVLPAGDRPSEHPSPQVSSPTRAESPGSARNSR